MKAFLTGVALMLAITALAAVSSSFVPNQASKEVYQDRSAVRL